MAHMKFDFSKSGFLEVAVVTAAIGTVLLFVTWQIASKPVPPDSVQLQEEVDFLAEELGSINRRMQRLQARNVVLERESDVLRQANHLLREQESARQAELNQQKSQLDFFRRLAGTGGAQSGLDVYHAELLPTDSPRVFQYVLTLTQNIRKASIVSGRVRIDIEGTQDDRPVTLYWSRISGSNEPQPQFRFKYFQQLEGYLTLPEAFSPTRLRITLEAEDRRKPVHHSYDWAALLGGEAAPMPAGSG